MTERSSWVTIGSVTTIAAQNPVRPRPLARIVARLPGRWRRRADALPGAWAPPVPEGADTPRIAIIGSGFGGLGLGARLRQAGIESFTIFEKADDVGGTWRDNTYPGAACDVPSHLYSLSFAPKIDWSRRFPEQAEIHAYLREVRDRFGLARHLRHGVTVESLTFDEDVAGGEWIVRLADGTEERFDVVVSATGQLNRPHVPDIPGLDDFGGVAFHSARWRHDVDLEGKDVVVVGIGASAIQFVPEIAKTARSVTLVQRSVNYVAPKPDRPFSDRELRAFRTVPGLARLYRASIWARFEARWVLLRKGSRSAEIAQRAFRDRLGKAVSDRLPAEVLLPDYPIGCRRILISNDWYPTIMAPHVRVVPGGADRIGVDGVVADGEHHRADVIVFGTGFEATDFLVPMTVTGRGGRDLHEEWRDGAEAHLGMTVNGFPNLFMLYGPNTNLGHNSIIFMLERQIGYVLSCLRRVMSDGTRSLEVRRDAQAASNRQLEKELGRTVWAADCASWYKTDSGRITNNWSGPTYRYWLRTLKPRWGDFTFGR